MSSDELEGRIPTVKIKTHTEFSQLGTVYPVGTTGELPVFVWETAKDFYGEYWEVVDND